MPTIFWKKIGKGSWINIGGGVPISSRSEVLAIPQIDARRGRTISQQFQGLVDNNFFNTTGAQRRALHTLRHMGANIPQDFGLSEL